MSEETLPAAEPEDFAILFALDQLEGRTATEEYRVPSDEALVVAARLYMETFGLLAYALPPQMPKIARRSRLLLALVGDETLPLVHRGRISSGPITLPSDVAAAAPAPPVRQAVAAPRSRGRSPWLSLAAALGVVALGLAGWLFMQVEEQRSTIARLEATLRQTQERASTTVASSTDVLAGLKGAADNLSLVTSPGVEVCALRPMGSPARQPAARGALFVAADHQHWYLAIHGLQPAPPGSRYQLWFQAGSLAFSGGTFEAKTGERVVLSSETMPAGTSGVLITLEPAAGSSTPSGPEVLGGNEMFRT